MRPTTIRRGNQISVAECACSISLRSVVGGRVSLWLPYFPVSLCEGSRNHRYTGWTRAQPYPTPPYPLKGTPATVRTAGVTSTRQHTTLQGWVCLEAAQNSF